MDDSGKDSGKSVYRRLAGREKSLRTGAEGLCLLIRRLGGPQQSKLIRLWKGWDAVMGEDLAALCRPLGHKERVLSLGAEESMALQELSLRGPEILELANEFMGEEYFDAVRVELLQGDAGLAATPCAVETAPVGPPPPPPLHNPPDIGGLIGKLSPDSPVTRCYETMVALARKQK